ncbi:MAG: MerR family transcriptional regulator [Lachnospiraceae bacterium]|nr:MerR family transcriptional regulator [Lachnospiraceae bacterium]
MKDKGIFSVSAFAKYSRTTKDALLHYDRIGLLSPTFRAENGYRYYHPGQLAIINVIRTMQDLGLTLVEIKEIINGRSQDNIAAIFTEQIGKIDEKIDDLYNTKELFVTLRNNVAIGLAVKEKSLGIEYVKEASYTLGEQNDYSKGANDFDALNVFYSKTQERYPKLSLNYPVWGYFRPERIKKYDWRWPDKYFFYHPQGEEVRPGGLYCVGYTRGGYGECGELYKRSLAYIEKNGYEVFEGAYEEYLLNEIFITDEKNYLIRLMISVREKESPS